MARLVSWSFSHGRGRYWMVNWVNYWVNYEQNCDIVPGQILLETCPMNLTFWSPEITVSIHKNAQTE